VRLLGGILTGALMYLMRSSGGWPDGIAFAVLAANAVTPFADRILIAASAPRRGAAFDASRSFAAARRHAPDAVRALMLLALLMIDWRGAVQSGAPSPAEVTDALLAEMAAIGYTQQHAFSVQDPALLGLPAPRQAWRLRSSSGSAAVVLPLRAHEGYGGPIDLLLAADERGRVLAVRVTAHTESAGFADPLDAPEHTWLRAFEGRGMADARWTLRKEGGDFDAFTGATVTPRAIVAAVRKGLQYVTEHRPALLGKTPPQDDGR
jgi:electron transport complex protein RnfG